MIGVGVDLSAIEAMTKAAIAELETIPKVMRSIADLGAAYERANHEYVNRTFTLQRQTKAKTLRYGAREARIELGMYTSYAVYVRARRLSEIDHAASQVEQAIEEAFEKFGPK